MSVLSAPILLWFILGCFRVLLFLSVIRIARNVLRLEGMVSVAFALSFVRIPSVPSEVPSVGTILLVCGQSLIAALPLSLASECVGVPGRLCDLLRGAQQSEQLVFEERSSLLEKGFELLAGCLFLSAGGGVYVASLLSAEPSSPDLFGIAAFFSSTFFQSFLLAAPVLLVFLLFELLSLPLARLDATAYQEIVPVLRPLLGIAAFLFLLALSRAEEFLSRAFPFKPW